MVLVRFATVLMGLFIGAPMALADMFARPDALCGTPSAQGIDVAPWAPSTTFRGEYGCSSRPRLINDGAGSIAVTVVGNAPLRATEASIIATVSDAKQRDAIVERLRAVLTGWLRIDADRRIPAEFERALQAGEPTTLKTDFGTLALRREPVGPAELWRVVLTPGAGSRAAAQKDIAPMPAPARDSAPAAAAPAREAPLAQSAPAPIPPLPPSAPVAPAPTPAAEAGAGGVVEPTPPPKPVTWSPQQEPGFCRAVVAKVAGVPASVLEGDRAAVQEAGVRSMLFNAPGGARSTYLCMLYGDGRWRVTGKSSTEVAFRTLAEGRVNAASTRR
ncbi:MAG TPA: hypothetical protein VFS42_10490 [Burkholderiaceae bacterium]|nr:hypothetical protein [Burkholderiaceae bacterium]